jgi:hypothetical protein
VESGSVGARDGRSAWPGTVRRSLADLAFSIQ